MGVSQPGIIGFQRLLAVEVLLSEPESLGDDVLESCLYILPSEPVFPQRSRCGLALRSAQRCGGAPRPRCGRRCSGGPARLRAGPPGVWGDARQRFPWVCPSARARRAAHAALLAGHLPRRSISLFDVRRSGRLGSLAVPSASMRGHLAFLCLFRARRPPGHAGQAGLKGRP